nr:Chain C, R1 peptide [synthetic construct]3SRJ_D Chain D, R1 peptide [synthetic construct]3SRJ_E Chain E, R1 peptide [synthetic construct]3SRJ_F Chain F, R1 peptide [synthetic construct]
VFAEFLPLFSKFGSRMHILK